MTDSAESHALERARALLRTGRSELALEELARALSATPDDASAHALMAQALADLERFQEAHDAAERAVGAAPDWAFPQYVTASLWLRQGKAAPALVAAQAAVALDPGSEDYHAMVAAAFSGQARWHDAQAAAERGLALAPDHVQCTNLRALALRQLGRLDEAEAALTGSLVADPENAWTFQNLGFAALKGGRASEAIEHFRESLRLDPGDEQSRVGLAEALKARVPLYRPIIAWQMLCSRLSSRAGIGLILGLFVLNNVIQRVAPEGSRVATVALVLYASLVWMSWAADALFDVLLLLRSDLRRLLTPRERVAAGGVVGCLLLGAAFVVAALVTDLPGLEWQALAAAFAAIPVAGWTKLPNGKARVVGASLALLAVALLIGAAALDVSVLNALGWNSDTLVPVALHDRLEHRLSLASMLGSLALLVSVGSSWVLMGLGFVPEARGGRGTRRRPR